MVRYTATGFTLVELLVTLSVIAVLVAMLLPSLATARSISRMARCKANIHQQLVAVSVYAVDYNGYGPHERGVNFNYDPNAVAANSWTNGGSAARWMKKLCLYLGAAKNTQYTTQVWSYDAHTPDKDYSVFRCPETYHLPVLSGSGQSYGMNVYLATDFTSGNIVIGTPLAAASPINLYRGLASNRLSELSAIADSCYYQNQNLTHGLGLWLPAGIWGHNQRINAGMADGHVVGIDKTSPFIYLKTYLNNQTAVMDTF